MPRLTLPDILATSVSHYTDALIQSIFKKIRISVNEQVASFTKVIRIFEQKESFERTPTQKIKRYLYLNSESR